VPCHRKLRRLFPPRQVARTHAGLTAGSGVSARRSWWWTGKTPSTPRYRPEGLPAEPLPGLPSPRLTFTGRLRCQPAPDADQGRLRSRRCGCRS